MSSEKKQPGLVRSIGVVSAFTLLSRVLGLARDVVVAMVFGASLQADAFFVAFKVPNFFRRLAAEGAFSQAFVPVLAEYKNKSSHDEVRQLLAAMAGTLISVLLMLTLLMILFAPWVIWAFAPGFSQTGGKMDLASDLLRLTFPYLPCIAMVALCAAALNTYHHFAAPAFAPVLLNLTLIACAVWLAPRLSEPIMALGWGVLFAGVLQLLVQLPYMRQKNLYVRPRVQFSHPGVKRVGALMIPALFGVSVGQINMLLDTVLASFLQNGSVSWLYFADRLMELPLGVFGIAIGSVILPRLSQHHVDASEDQFSRTLDWGIRWVLIIGVPASVALCFLAEPVIATLFNYREFSDRDVIFSSQALMAYALAVVPLMLVKVLAPGFYARQDTKTPVKIAVISMTVNMVLNLLLIIPLAHVGLALATSVAAMVNAGLLANKLKLKPRGWMSFLAKLCLATGVMLLVLWALSPERDLWYSGGLMIRMSELAKLMLAGVVSYFGVLWLLKIRLRALLHP